MEKFIPSVQLIFVLIGIVILISLLSLLVSIILEMWTMILDTRQKTLLTAIKELFMHDEKLYKQFIAHPRFRQIAGTGQKSGEAPRYLSSDSFADIFLEILLLKGLKDKREETVLSDIREFNAFLKMRFEECNSNVSRFKLFLENWYNEKMDSAYEIYRTKATYKLFFISIFIAVLFNAEIIGVYSKITESLQAGSVQTISAVADNLQKITAMDSSLRDSAAVKNITSELLSLMHQSLMLERQNYRIVPGQNEADTLFIWLRRLTGYLVSALLLAFGARSWRDVVSKLVSIRASGPLAPRPVLMEDNPSPPPQEAS